MCIFYFISKCRDILHRQVELFCDMLNKIRNDFLKHNFETYRFLKQQIMIWFSGTMKRNMFQIHLKEMRPGFANKICR
jgi:hypothetical protein